MQLGMWKVILAQAILAEGKVTFCVFSRVVLTKQDLGCRWALRRSVFAVVGPAH